MYVYNHDCPVSQCIISKLSCVCRKRKVRSVRRRKPVKERRVRESRVRESKARESRETVTKERRKTLSSLRYTLNNHISSSSDP